MANNVHRKAIPWDNLRDHVSAQFLNVDEEAALRDEVEKVRQSVYEPEAQYPRRFREVAHATYPMAQRNADQERILIKMYSKGLRSDGIARKLTMDINPNNLEAALVKGLVNPFPRFPPPP